MIFFSNKCKWIFFGCFNPVNIVFVIIYIIQMNNFRGDLTNITTKYKITGYWTVQWRLVILHSNRLHALRSISLIRRLLHLWHKPLTRTVFFFQEWQKSFWDTLILALIYCLIKITDARSDVTNKSAERYKITFAAIPTALT